MGHKRHNVLPRGQHLVTTHDGDVRHTDQVTMGLYGKQKGRVVEIDDLDGPDAETMRKISRERLPERRPLRLPITGPEREDD